MTDDDRREVEEKLRRVLATGWRAKDHAAWELYKRPNVLAEIREFLTHPEPLLRYNAAYMIASYNKGELLRTLDALLDDPDEDVRHMMCDLHGHYNAAASVEFLTRMLQSDPSPDVRVEAAHHLGNIGDERVIPVLEGALADEGEDMQGHQIRDVAQNAIDLIRRRLAGR